MKTLVFVGKLLKIIVEFATGLFLSFLTVIWTMLTFIMLAKNPVDSVGAAVAVAWMFILLLGVGAGTAVVLYEAIKDTSSLWKTKN